MMKNAIKNLDKQCFACGKDGCRLVSSETVCGMRYYVKCDRCGAIGLEAFEPGRAIYDWNTWGDRGYE